MSGVLYALMRRIVWCIARGYLIGIFRVRGADSIPRRGALLICANHCSSADPPLIPALVPRGDTWSMAKSEYFEGSRRLRWLMRAYHAFPIVRHSPDRAALRRGSAVLAAGGTLIVYPEGTRVEVGGLIRPEAGAGFIARHSQAPVVAVGLVGTQECFPKGSRFPRRVPVEVRFGSPFTIAERRPDGSRITNQEAADAVMLQIAHLLPASMRGEFADLEGWSERLLGVVREASQQIPGGPDPPSGTGGA